MALVSRPVTRLGRFEGRRHDAVVGWAFDPGRPRWRAMVRLRADTGAEAVATAERYRADVQDAGHGDGYAGFAIPLVRFAGARKIRCWWDDLGTELPGSPAILASPAVLAQADDGVLQVAVDRQVPGDWRLTGWAIDLANPSHRPVLGLSSAEGTLGQARACLYRPELRRRGRDGFNGFSFARGRPGPGQVVRLLDLARGTVLLEIAG